MSYLEKFTEVALIFKKYIINRIAAIESFYILILAFFAYAWGNAVDKNDLFYIGSVGNAAWPFLFAWYCYLEIAKLLHNPDALPFLINPIATLAAFTLNDITLVEFIIKINVQIMARLVALIFVMTIMGCYDENSEYAFLTTYTLENIKLACNAESIKEIVAKYSYPHFCVGFGLTLMYCNFIKDARVSNFSKKMKIIFGVAFSATAFLFHSKMLEYNNRPNFSGNVRTIYPCENILNFLASFIGMLVCTGFYKYGYRKITYLVTLVIIFTLYNPDKTYFGF